MTSISQSNSFLQPLHFSYGSLAIGHRLRTQSVADAMNEGVTHILTLISESEGALDVQKAVVDEGIDWLWLPLANAQPPEETRLDEIIKLYKTCKELLDAGAYIYVHCSAGIHRTGMVTYGLLRYMGFNAAEAFAQLQHLRPLSSQEVGLKRLNWGDQFAPGYNPELPLGPITLERFLQHNYIGYACYAHSTGEGYQYRAEVGQVYEDGGLRLVKVQTSDSDGNAFSNGNDFKDPNQIRGHWVPYEDFDYRSNQISIEVCPKGIIISYAHAGVVYLHRRALRMDARPLIYR